MTKEEAIELINDVMTDAVYQILSEEKEALQMAIEALSQEPCNDVISRQAVDNLRRYVDGKENTEKIEINVLQLNRIIKALEQEPCDDAISREDAKECKELMTDINGDTVYAVRMSDIRQLPPVTPSRRKGKWINIEDRTNWYDATYKCSCCGREIITPYELKNNLYSGYPYCHCGAKMESEDKE